jgi:hypothetical protein
VTLAALISYASRTGKRLDSNADGRRGTGAHPDRFAHDLNDVEAAQQRANHYS